MDDHSRYLLPLGEALRRLPPEAPVRSAWPALATRLPTPGPSRGPLRWPLALAAGLLAVMLVPGGLPGGNRTAVPASPASQSVELGPLMAESAQLERLVAAASDDGASSATAAAISLALNDRLRALDAELEGNRDPGRQMALWQQRVELLRDMAGVETSRHYLAAQGRSLDVAMVAAY